MSESKAHKSPSNLEFIKCFVGIFISYWIFGLIQESM